MAKVIIVVAAVVLVFLVVAVARRVREESSEVREWKRTAAIATKDEFVFEIDEPFAIERDEQSVLAIAGAVVQGKAEVGDAVVISTTAGPVTTKLLAIEMFRKELDVANPGDMIAIIVSGIDKADMKKGSTVTMSK